LKSLPPPPDVLFSPSSGLSTCCGLTLSLIPCLHFPLLGLLLPVRWPGPSCFSLNTPPLYPPKFFLCPCPFPHFPLPCLSLLFVHFPVCGFPLHAICHFFQCAEFPAAQCSPALCPHLRMTLLSFGPFFPRLFLPPPLYYRPPAFRCPVRLPVLVSFHFDPFPLSIPLLLELRVALFDFPKQTFSP